MSRESFLTWKSKECCCSHNDTGNCENPTNTRSPTHQHSCSGLERELDQFRKPPTGPRANVYGRSSHGRRRSESAPDALLDCLHCGKDLACPRLDGSPSCKRGHARRSTANNTASSLGTSFAWKQRRVGTGVKYEVCDQCCQCGRRRNDVRSDRTGRGSFEDKYCCEDAATLGKSLSFHFREDNARYGDSLESPITKTTLIRRSGDGSPLERPAKQPHRYSKQSCSEKRAAADSLLADERLGRDDFPHRCRHRSVDFDQMLLKCNGDFEDDTTYDDDAEAGFVNVNENRRRRSVITCSEHHRQGAGWKGTTQVKHKRRSYPGYVSKRRSSPLLRVDNLVESLKEQLRLPCTHNPCPNTHSSKHRAAECRHGRIEKSGDKTQQPTTSEDDDGNGEESESVAEEPLQSGRRRSSGSLLMTNLSDMWRRHRLCDVILRSNGQEIAAHKLALAAFSDTFARRYCEGEGRESLVLITVPDTSVGGIQEVLRFVYTGDIRITSDNVAHVLAAATFLHIDVIVNMCKQVSGPETDSDIYI